MLQGVAGIVSRKNINSLDFLNIKEFCMRVNIFLKKARHYLPLYKKFLQISKSKQFNFFRETHSNSRTFQ